LAFCFTSCIIPDTISCVKVYRITFPHGKIYVGVEKNYRQRWGAHKRAESGQLVDNKIKKYGWKNCKFEYVFEGSPEQCWGKEQELIRLWGLKDYVKGYNLTDGGENNAGRKWSEEKKKKWKELMKGKWVQTPEFFAKARLAAKTRIRTKEEWEKKSTSMKLAWKTSTRLKNRKIVLSDEARKRMGFNKGFTPWNKGKTGLQSAWSKGKTFPYKPRPKMKEAWQRSERLKNRKKGGS